MTQTGMLGGLNCTIFDGHGQGVERLGGGLWVCIWSCFFCCLASVAFGLVFYGGH